MRVARLFLLLGAALLILHPVDARADYSRSQNWFNGLSDWERRGIQANLILGGYYRGLADGKFGRNTYNALIAFEREHSFFPNGHLNQLEASLLVKAAREWTASFQINDARDDRAGISLPLPYALVSRQQETERGTIWSSSNVPFEVQTAAFLAGETPLDVLYDASASADVSPGLEYRFLGADFFVLSGSHSGGNYYKHFRQNGRHISGFTVLWAKSLDSRAARMPVYIASKASYFAPRHPPPPLLPERGLDAQPPQAWAQPDTPSARAPSQPRAGTRSSGSGFFVSATGLILTNHHVVDGCTAIDVAGHGRAEVLRNSSDLDLAAILVREPPLTQRTARFGTDAPALGSKVVAGGFPLSNLLNNSFTLAYGQVTMRGGKALNNRDFAMSAALQPGNSGGAVINERGEVVGVAVAKFNDAKLIEIAGTTGANFSFAIDGAYAREFLRPFAVEGRSEPTDNQAALTDVELAARLESVSVQVLCSR